MAAYLSVASVGVVSAGVGIGGLWFQHKPSRVAALSLSGFPSGQPFGTGTNGAGIGKVKVQGL